MSPSDPKRIVVLISGSGTNLQALIDADQAGTLSGNVVAVGADRGDIEGLKRAERAGIDHFICSVSDYPDRQAWDQALTEHVAAHKPDLVVLAGFLKMNGPAFLAQFQGRTINTHPALSPAFPGIRAPQEALDYGCKITGATLFFIDAGMDTGVVIDQRAVPVLETDDVATLHERIKVEERDMLTTWVSRMCRDGWHLDGRTFRTGNPAD